MDDHCELVHGGIPSKTKGLISMTHFIPADSEKTNWFGAGVDPCGVMNAVLEGHVSCLNYQLKECPTDKGEVGEDEAKMWLGRMILNPGMLKTGCVELNQELHLDEVSLILMNAIRMKKLFGGNALISRFRIRFWCPSSIALVKLVLD